MASSSGGTGRRSTSAVGLAIVALGWMTLPGHAPADAAPPGGPETPARGQETAAGWTLESDDEVTRVFARSTSGSRVREVLVRSTIAAPPERVLEVIADYAHYAEFMPYVEESRVVEELEGQPWLFTQLDLPWPIGDRYYTIAIATTRTESERPSIRVEWTMVDPEQHLPVGRGVAVTVNDGYWELQATADGARTDVTYYVHTDPAGDLPTWAIDFANARAAPQVIEAVRSRAERD